MPFSIRTPLTDLLGCRHPVVQTAMGWVADARLTAATCNAGGFGFLAGATIEAGKVELVPDLAAAGLGASYWIDKGVATAIGEPAREAA